MGNSYCCASLTLPWALTVGLPLVLVLRLLGLVEKLTYDREDMVLYARLSTRGAHRWRYSTTLGHVVLLHPKADEGTIQHELVHVRQHEDLVLLGFLVGLAVYLVTGHLWLALGIWWSAGLWQLPMYLTALLRYGRKHCYLDAEHERAAYAQTDPAPFAASSFLERRARDRATGKA